MKVLLRTPLSMATALGIDGISMVQAMVARGWDVSLDPTTVEVPLPYDVALLLAKDPEPPFDVAVSHCPPDEVAEVRANARMHLYWSMWERSTYDAQTLADGLGAFDGVLAYDPVSQAAYASVGASSDVLQGGYPAVDWPSMESEREWFGTFRFGSVSSEPPNDVIKAFTQLKSEHGDDFDSELRILRFHEVGSVLEMRQFYAALNAYVSPSRDRLPALQALSTGIPVIAPAHGSHSVWMSSEYAYPVDFEVVYGRCEVSIESLATQMWAAYSNRGEARRRGGVAARTIPAIADWQQVLDKFERMVYQRLAVA